MSPQPPLAAHVPDFQRRAFVPAVVVGGEGVAVERIAHVLRYLPAHQIAEAAHIAAGGDSGDLVGSERIWVCIRRAAKNSRQPVAAAIIDVALRTVETDRGPQAVTVGKQLAEAGCDEQTIAAVLRHRTATMARHYSEEANRTKRADAAMLQIERMPKKGI